MTSGMPVEDPALHHPRSLTVTESGVPESRRCHLVDARRRLLDGKQHNLLGRLTARLEASGGK